MQSQSIILLAEVRHNEFQSEAARLRIVNQACAKRAAPKQVVASEQGRFRTALANVAARLQVRVHLQRVLATTSGNGRSVVSGLGAETR
jgi:hypothetical protein